MSMKFCCRKRAWYGRAPADVTLDAVFDAFEAEISEQNEEIEDEVPAVEPELMFVSDMITTTLGAKIYDGKRN